MTREPAPTPAPAPVDPVVASVPGPVVTFGLSETRGDRVLNLLAWGAGAVLVVGLAGLAALGMSWVQDHKMTPMPVVQPAAPTDLVEVVRAQPVEPSRPMREIRPDGKVVTNPSWIAAPRPEFPALAKIRGVEAGTVELDCHVTVQGRIDVCNVVSETPAGAGFASAAIQATRDARLLPRTVDNVATETRVRFTARFALK